MSYDKHYFLWRYLNAFTTAMGKKNWVGLHYIDLCAGAGIQRLKGSNQLEWGSPLLAAQAKRPFDGLHLCEKSKKKGDALRERLKQFQQPADPQLVAGDANKNVTKIVNVIPLGALSLAFLDPNGLHLHFSTLDGAGTCGTEDRSNHLLPGSPRCTAKLGTLQEEPRLQS